MSIPRVSLSPGGPHVSRLVFGTWRIKEDPKGFGPEHVLYKIQKCLDAGITTFDLADIYGDYECEAIFGAALKKSPGLREKIEIVTKCGIVAPSPGRPGVTTKHYNASSEAIVTSIEKALKNLGTDFIDLLLIHRPDWFSRADNTARGLDAVVDDGKVRHVGVSNYSESEFSLLKSQTRNPLSTNQIELSLFHMKALYDGVLSQCERFGIRPMAWSPLGGGRLFDPSDATAKQILKVATRLSDAYDGASSEELALAWILALPSEPIVVLGTNRPERITAATGATAIRLKREDWYALWEAAQGREVP